MSSSIWTPRAVASEATHSKLELWRAVEAQHVVATRALVDSLAEQEVLEAILEESKPPIPAACAGYDYLLYTPFRYPPSLHGSRFRITTTQVSGMEQKRCVPAAPSWGMAVAFRNR